MAITNRIMRDKMGAFLKKYPEKEELSKMYQLMSENIRKFQMELNYLQPEIIEEDSVFTHIRWEIQATATFQKFMEFLRDLEVRHHFFQIEKIHLHKDNKTNEFLTIRLHLKLILTAFDL
jgi:hypothetical protein